MIYDYMAPWSSATPHRGGVTTSNIAAAAHPEDSQPNESIDGRRRGNPPLVHHTVTTVPPRRRDFGWRGRGRGAAAPRDGIHRNGTRGAGLSSVPASSNVSLPHNGIQSSYNNNQPGSSRDVPPKSAWSGTPRGTRIEDDEGHHSYYDRIPSPPSSTRMAAPTYAPLPSPSAKRRRLSDNADREGFSALRRDSVASTSTSIASSSAAQHPEKVVVKREETPPTVPLPSRRLITSGAKLYAPVPLDCQKTGHNYKASREAWSKTERDALRRLGLKVVRIFIREDGMVIDWTSPRPVWSDTLQPETTDLASAISQVYAANDQTSRNNTPRKKKTMSSPQQPQGVSTTEVTDADVPESPTHKNTIPPPEISGPPNSSPFPVTAEYVSASAEQRPSSRAQSALARKPHVIPSDPSSSTTTTEPPSLPTKTPNGHRPTDIETISIRSPPNDNTQRPPKTPTPTYDPNRAEVVETLARHEVEKLEDAALAFLERYIQTFDKDRSALASAYSRHASFSYRIHERPSRPGVPPFSKAELFAPRIDSRVMSGSRNHFGIKQGRLDIITTLLSLGSHKFCPSGLANVDYDVVYLGETSDLLLVCYAEVIDVQRSNHRLSCDQSFILRQKERDEEDRLAEAVWPLVAVSHQMTIRDMVEVSSARGLTPKKHR